ncbi:phage regulatory CII family protein [Paradevosia shaoguanensis]|uniref:Tape measure protein n=1 Tax=Paradevosia shaoguanensis TaxID=1335043 RepID=A0AA41QPL4_9HYPH|nr:phage regulatory CII family protein [Paradevosia shaoguanensis]MCF1744194.1 tape measure protein [Paradevosia shaoguanensis]MCI0128677.1 tape measure protein [Paradevosia shaoguanensis]
MMGRRLSGQTYGLVKARFDQLLDRLGGSTGAAGYTRLSQPDLSRCASTSEHNADRFVAIDVLADLEDAAGDPVVSRELCARLGFLVVPLPKGEGPAQVLKASGRSASEMGKLMVEVGAALADGRIDMREANTILKGVNQVMIDLAHLAESVRQEAFREEDRS